MHSYLLKREQHDDVLRLDLFLLKRAVPAGIAGIRTIVAEHEVFVVCQRHRSKVLSEAAVGALAALVVLVEEIFCHSFAVDKQLILTVFDCFPRQPDHALDKIFLLFRHVDDRDIKTL